jgi:hypothetical protein
MTVLFSFFMGATNRLVQMILTTTFLYHLLLSTNKYHYFVTGFHIHSRDGRVAVTYRPARRDQQSLYYDNSNYYYYSSSSSSSSSSRLCASMDSSSLSSSSSSSAWEENLQQLKRIQECQIQDAIMVKLFSPNNNNNNKAVAIKSASSSSSSLTTLYLLGQSKIPLASSVSRSDTTSTTTQKNFTQPSISSSTSMVTMLVLGDQPHQQEEGRNNINNNDSIRSILTPLTSPNQQLRLLNFAYKKRPVPSLTVLLTLNALLVNRDDGVFDNIPWSIWSIDPQKRNYDAARNPIDSKYHLGKRDAYNRLMGKDWPGRSIALGNLALRLQYMIVPASSSSSSSTTGPSSSTSTASGLTDTDAVEAEEEETQRSLLGRVLQLRIKELQMEIADIDSQLAIVRNNYDDENFITTETAVSDLETRKIDLQNSLTRAEDDLVLVQNITTTTSTTTTTTNTPSGSITSILDRIANWSTSQNTNAAPYRGAMGYAPMLDTRQEVDGASLAMDQYCSPYDVLKEVLRDQLNAKVIGCVLENTSLLKGNTVLGGAIVLQRLTPTRSMKVAGEEVQYNDYDETFGNEGIQGGEIFVVDCYVDEAIGMSLACNLPLNLEPSIWDASSVSVERVGAASEAPMPTEDTSKYESKQNIKDALPKWRVADTEMSLQVEGDGDTVSRPSPISIPLTTSSLFDSIFERKPARSSGTSMFPTDNPIKSLDTLDGLTTEEKAKTLLQMSNFNGKLPRPRVIRNAPPNANPLDKLLLPLIDESVRKQYAIREATKNGDWDLVNELTASKSKLQDARERADAARNDGNNDLATQLDEEVRLLESLRADVTQDVGSYSRFLDRDDWYERDRLKAAKRAKKSSFGNLLDGIE